MMTAQFKKGFFEFIAAADAEKVHSQTIGWIFSEYCTVFSPIEKIQILNELIGVNIGSQSIFFSNNETINVKVEVDNLDILISGDKWFIVIENKIKSSQHSRQLFKYEYITATDRQSSIDAYENWKSLKLPDDFKQEYLIADNSKKLNVVKKKWANKFKDFKMELDAQFNGKKAKYIYLTLIQEQPESDEWSSLTYLKLTETLVKYLKNKTSTEDFVILNTYINTIHNLSKTAASFIQNPKNYDFVFIEGKKAKRKIETNGVIEYTSTSYLRDLQLETLLQKWFYSNLITSINNMNDDPLEILRSNIGETRGNALLDFFFEEIKIDNINYNPILQFQGKSVKLAIVVPEKDKLNKKLSQADIKVIKDKRRIKYAEKLSKSTMFCDIFEINKNDHHAIFSDISIPKTADGFISINLNTKDKYWQFDDDPQNYIIDMIKKARTIFQQIND